MSEGDVVFICFGYMPSDDICKLEGDAYADFL